MRVTVYYTAQARAAAGCDDETIELADGATALEALQLLCRRHGEGLGRILMQESLQPRPAIAVFVNERQVNWQAPAALREGDRVLLLSPIAGG